MRIRNWLAWGAGPMLLATLGCTEIGSPTPGGGSVLLRLNTARALSGQTLDVAAFYKRQNESSVPLGTQHFALNDSPTQTISAEIDVSACLADPDREESGAGCRLYLTLTLRNAAEEVLDVSQLGPLDAVPGQTLTAPGVTLREAASIALSAPSGSVLVGQTLQVGALVTDRANTPLTGRVLHWTSSNPATASVNSNGLVTAVTHGDFTVTATIEGVSNGPVGTLVLHSQGGISLAISSSGATIARGLSLPVTATLTRTGGFTGLVNFTLTGSPLPTGVTAVVSNVVNTGATTTATVTIGVDLATALGTYPLVLHATGTGVTEATAPFSLTVTAVASSLVFVSGRVIDFITQNGIPNATVSILDNASVIVGNATTSANGGFTSAGLTVSNPSLGGYVQAQATGYVTARIHFAAFATTGTTVTETVPLVPQTTQQGGISGTVRNATTSQPIAGATVGLSIIGNTSFSRTTTSDANGNFSFTLLQAGTYDLSGTASGFNSVARTAVAIGNSGVTPGQDIVLSPVGTGIRIVVTWGAQPGDLDAHLTGPDGGSGRFHVYFSNRGSLVSAPFAALDVDDVSSFGPETITIAQLNSGGVYRYSVHDFTNSGSTSSSALGQSGAKVEVYDNQGGVHTFFVPNQPGTLWTVFELTGPANNPVITPLNLMTFVSNPGGITSPPALHGIATDAELIGRVTQHRKTKPH